MCGYRWGDRRPCLQVQPPPPSRLLPLVGSTDVWVGGCGTGRRSMTQDVGGGGGGVFLVRHVGFVGSWELWEDTSWARRPVVWKGVGGVVARWTVRWELGGAGWAGWVGHWVVRGGSGEVAVGLALQAQWRPLLTSRGGARGAVVPGGRSDAGGRVRVRMWVRRQAVMHRSGAQASARGRVVPRRTSDAGERVSYVHWAGTHPNVGR